MKYFLTSILFLFMISYLSAERNSPPKEKDGVESISIEATLCDGTLEFYEFNPTVDVECELENLFSRDDVAQCRICVHYSNGTFCCAEGDCKYVHIGFAKGCGIEVEPMGD